MLYVTYTMGGKVERLKYKEIVVGVWGERTSLDGW
jgi:hypothetical protein